MEATTSGLPGRDERANEVAITGPRTPAELITDVSTA